MEKYSIEKGRAEVTVPAPVLDFFEANPDLSEKPKRMRGAIQMISRNDTSFYFEHEGWRWIRTESGVYERFNPDVRGIIERHLEAYFEKLRSMAGEIVPSEETLPSFSESIEGGHSYVIPGTGYKLSINTCDGGPFLLSLDIDQFVRPAEDVPEGTEVAMMFVYPKNDFLNPNLTHQPSVVVGGMIYEGR